MQFENMYSEWIAHEPLILHRQMTLAQWILYSWSLKVQSIIIAVNVVFTRSRAGCHFVDHSSWLSIFSVVSRALNKQVNSSLCSRGAAASGFCASRFLRNYFRALLQFDNESWNHHSSAEEASLSSEHTHPAELQGTVKGVKFVRHLWVWT